MKDSAFHRLWLTESIRLTEQQSGPLDDIQINRKVSTQSEDVQQRIINRGFLLAQRDGLVTALHQWLQSARITSFVLLIIAMFTGIGLAIAALGDNVRPVNIFWATGSLLGLHIITLIIWLFSLFFLPAESGNTLGRFWLWLTEKFARTARAVQLVPALMVLLNRQKATRWGLGICVHGFWSVVLTSSLLTLLALLSTKQYNFTWETTLLSNETFVRVTHTLGILPSWLGFPIPDEMTIKASGNHVINNDSVRHAWAGWLVGVLTLFGVAIRLLLTLYCFIRWRLSVAKLKIDLSLPENQVLMERLQPRTQSLGITDAAPDTIETTNRHIKPLQSDGYVLTGIELNDRISWPPDLPAFIHDAGLLNNRFQRNALLSQLQQHPAAKLLIACDPSRSADRGTLRLLAELADNASETRVWLLKRDDNDGPRLEHWEQSIQQLGLEQGDISWLEQHDE